MSVFVEITRPLLPKTVERLSLAQLILLVIDKFQWIEHVLRFLGRFVGGVGLFNLVGLRTEIQHGLWKRKIRENGAKPFAVVTSGSLWLLLLIGLVWSAFAGFMEVTGRKLGVEWQAFMQVPQKEVCWYPYSKGR